MNSQPENHELSRQTVKDLRALGGVQAPRELWQRVQDQRLLEELGSVAAPKELWERVQAERQHDQVETSPAVGTKPHEILRPVFGAKRLVAAAAILVLGGIAFLNDEDGQQGLDEDLVLASVTPEEVRAGFRAKLTVVVGDPSEMSLVAKGLAGALGGSMVEDDA